MMAIDKKMKELYDMLENGVRDLFSTDEYKKYLAVMGRFSTYSINNQILIASQRPDATLVAGYKSWEKNCNRHVKKGEKGIWIIAPMPVQVKRKREARDEQGNVIMEEDGTQKMEEVSITIPRFRAIAVFDVSQTEGEPLPERPGVTMLTASVADYTEFLKAIRKTCPVPIRFSDEISGTANGYYDPQQKEIVIRDGMSQSQTIKTLVHEMAHARIHDPDELRKHEAERVDQTTREVEAESVAYVVLQHFGIDSSDYTFPYVAAWSANTETPELKNSMERICQTSSEMISALQAAMEAERNGQEQVMQDDMPTKKSKVEYEIYQLVKDDVPYEYMGMNFIEKNNLKVSVDDYIRVYSGSISGRDDNDVLNQLYHQFNADSRPDDYQGHSMSVSDVVVLYHADGSEAYYVDSHGFVNLSDFAKELQQEIFKENFECARAIERAISDNFDGEHLRSEAMESVDMHFVSGCIDHVLATTVREKSYDGRFSPTTKQWAETVLQNEPTDNNCSKYVINSHPAILEVYIRAIRRMHGYEEQMPEKNTIKNKIRQKKKIIDQQDHWPYDQSSGREELSL